MSEDEVDVRDDVRYLAFYMSMGTAWLGATTLLLPLNMRFWSNNILIGRKRILCMSWRDGRKPESEFGEPLLNQSLPRKE